MGYAILISPQQEIGSVSYLKEVDDKSPMQDLPHSFKSNGSVHNIAPGIDVFYCDEASEYTDDVVVLSDADGEVLGTYFGSIFLLAGSKSGWSGFKMKRGQQILMSLNVNGKPAVPKLVSEHWARKH